MSSVAVGKISTSETEHLPDLTGIKKHHTQKNGVKTMTRIIIFQSLMFPLDIFKKQDTIFITVRNLHNDF
jgi:hypothetical protein